MGRLFLIKEKIMKKFLIVSFLILVVVSLNCAAHGIKESNEQKDETNAINQQGNLWILAIGVNEYPTENQNLFASLNYAVNDAHAFVDIFENQAGKQYGKVNTKIISDRSGTLPTKENIINGFEFLNQAQPEDTVFLFLSGQGLNENGLYYFMPRYIIFTNDGELIFESAISMDEIALLMNGVKGNKFIFIDSCGSGAAVYSDLLRTVLFTACQKDELSMESFLFNNHGLFTHALIEGLSGKAAFNGVVSINILSQFVFDKVRELSNGKQNPRIFFPKGFRDIVIMTVE